MEVSSQLPTLLANGWILDRAVPPFKIYPQLCCIQYLLNIIGVGNEFKFQLKTLLAKYPMVNIAAMGFSAHWDSEPLWR